MTYRLSPDKEIIIINNIINNSNIKEKTSYQNLNQRHFSPNFSRVNHIIPYNSKNLNTVNKNIKIEKYNNSYISTNNIENNNKNYRNIMSDRSLKSDLKLMNEPNNIIINKNNDDILSNEIKRYFEISSYKSIINRYPTFNTKTYNKKNLFPEPINIYKTINTNTSERNNNIMKIKTYNSPDSIRIIKKHENINYLISRNNNNLLKYNPILHHPNLATGNKFHNNEVLNNAKIKRKINCYKIKENNINNELLGSQTYSDIIEKKFNLKKGKMNKKISKNTVHINFANPKQMLYKRIFKSKYCGSDNNIKFYSNI